MLRNRCPTSAGIAVRLGPEYARIWRRDAYLAYQTMIDAITALEPLDPTRMNFSNWGHHSFNEKYLLLPEIARSLAVPDDD